MLLFRLGQPFIYPILDWSHPEKALIAAFGILFITIFVHIFLFWIYKLRVFVQRRFFGIEINLTTKSMEFDASNGYTNEAFKTTTSIVFE